MRRAAIVSPPDAQEGEQFPVVFVLHGHSTSPGQAMQWGGWGQAVVERRFIAVIPEGVGQSWNAGGCCRTAGQGTDGKAVGLVLFVGALLARRRKRRGSAR